MAAKETATGYERPVAVVISKLAQLEHILLLRCQLTMLR